MMRAGVMTQISAATVMVVLTLMALTLGHVAGDARAVSLAWGVAGLNGAAAALLHARGLDRPNDEFLKWAMGANTVRFMLLLGLITGVVLFELVPVVPFIVAILSGVAAYMVADVVQVRRMCKGSA